MRWLIQAIEAGRAPDLRRVLSTLTSARYAEGVAAARIEGQDDRSNPTLVTTAPQPVERKTTRRVACHG